MRLEMNSILGSLGESGGRSGFGWKKEAYLMEILTSRSTLRPLEVV